MITQRNATVASRGQAKTQTKFNKIRQGTKLYNVISHLVNGNRLHRFQAERICHDHVLPSTIASFERHYGILVARHLITVSGFTGSLVTVAEYWLDTHSRVKARALLEAA